MISKAELSLMVARKQGELLQDMYRSGCDVGVLHTPTIAMLVRELARISVELEILGLKVRRGGFSVVKTEPEGTEEG